MRLSRAGYRLPHGGFELLGQKYVFDLDVKGVIGATPNIEITKENAELLLTNALHMNGITRVPLGAPETFQVMRQRDGRDSAVPLVTADTETPPALPNHWDLITLRYKAKNPEIVDHLARTSRSFVPANSRIIGEEVTGSLLVTDSAKNVGKLYELFRELDQPVSSKLRARWEQQVKERMARKSGEGRVERKP